MYRQTNIVSYRTNEKKREGGKEKGNDVNMNLGKTKFDINDRLTNQVSCILDAVWKGVSSPKK